MDKSKVNMYLYQYKDKIPSDKVFSLKTALAKASDECEMPLAMLKLKNHILILMMSIFFGRLGVDRFLLGNLYRGMGKLMSFVFPILLMFLPLRMDAIILVYLSLLANLIWSFIDIFLCYKQAKEENLKALLRVLK
ncbi:MAG: hypothetical protein IJ371_00985 [Clostridia bacterium]|nr:hypothetical protein [Clostridia bacterium]